MRKRLVAIGFVIAALAVPATIWLAGSDEPETAPTEQTTEERPDTRAERYDLMRREGLTKIRDGILAHREGTEHQRALDNIEHQLAALGGEYYPQH